MVHTHTEGFPFKCGGEGEGGGGMGLTNDHN